MITVALLILGATFVYTGVLVFGSDSTAAVAMALIGLGLIAKPALDALHRITPPSGPPDRKGGGKGRKRPAHIHVVKNDRDGEENKPTIH